MRLTGTESCESEEARRIFPFILSAKGLVGNTSGSDSRGMIRGAHRDIAHPSTSWSLGKRRHDVLGEEFGGAARLVGGHRAEGEIADEVAGASSRDLDGNIGAYLRVGPAAGR